MTAIVSDEEVDGFREVRCLVDIPSDAETDPERRFDMAVNQAREDLPDYVIPAEWEKLSDDGEVVEIVRRSNIIRKGGAQ